MPIKFHPRCSSLRLAAFAVSVALANAAHGQTDDTSPFYVGGSVGVSHVSNVYRQADAGNSDTVTSIGLLGGIDQRLGRQHLTLDGSLQNNRYSTNRGLNNSSHSLRGALNWQTVGNLSGVVSVKSDRSLADFNIGNGADSDFRGKNTERNDEYAAIVRLGMLTRYSLEGGWTHKRRDFTAEQYDRFIYSQNTGQLGVYAMPGGNVRLGLVGRHTTGNNPRYPVYAPLIPSLPNSPIVQIGVAPNDYTRNDFDFTTNWTTGGSSTLNTRLSRSRVTNSLVTGIYGLRDFSGTTGSVGWNWRPTGKINLGLQYARDTGQETAGSAVDVNRIYTSWRLNGSYALTAKLGLNANASRNRSHRDGVSGGQVTDAFDNDEMYGIGARWAFSRGLSLSCQYNRASRDSSVPQYVYSASSYGCTGQAILY